MPKANVDGPGWSRGAAIGGVSMRCIGPGWPRSNKAAAAGGGGRGLALGLVDAPLPSEHACLLEERAVREEAVAIEEVVKQVVQLAMWLCTGVPVRMSRPKCGTVLSTFRGHADGERRGG